MYANSFMEDSTSQEKAQQEEPFAGQMYESVKANSGRVLTFRRTTIPYAIYDLSKTPGVQAQSIIVEGPRLR